MHFDLIIIGSGSGNSILTPDFDDWNVALIEKGVFGGTCLNRGCIPSKMFVLAADMVEHARHSARLGVDMEVTGVRWPDIVERVFGRIDPIADGGEDYRHGLDHVTVFKDEARFTAPHELHVGGHEITADQIVIAAGARPFLPPIAGLGQTPHYTSDTIMRMPELPDRLVVLGGGFIAAEMAHVFEALGSHVTIVNRRDVLLRDEDETVSRAFTEAVRDRFDLALNALVGSVEELDGQLCIEVSVDGHPSELFADALLVATGRMPNSDTLDVAAAGIATDDDGYVLIDEHGRTNVEGVWSLGDISNPQQLKHTANAETRVIAHNIAHPDDLRVIDLWPTPHAVFASPQIGSVGLTEQELRDRGRPYIAKIQHYGDVAYGWALEDSTSFCKLLADPESRMLLGAHIMGPQAATLVQQLIQGMKFGLTVDEMANGQLWIHPALPEVVENALLGL